MIKRGALAIMIGLGAPPIGWVVTTLFAHEKEIANHGAQFDYIKKALERIETKVDRK
jgi:hypothetical protein